MKVKSDHRSKFSSLSNWKEEAWKKNQPLLSSIPNLAIVKRFVQRRKWSPTANDPQTGNDPQIGPQMIPDVDRKWSQRKTRNGMEFAPPVEVSFF